MGRSWDPQIDACDKCTECFYFLDDPMSRFSA